MKASAIPVLLLGLALAMSARAQDPSQPPVPEKEHEWLQQFVGKWDLLLEIVATPQQPASKCKGTIDSRSLGGFWTISEYDNEMSGTKIKAIQTIGYDPATKKYVGTWVDSAYNHMWKYQGTVDPTGKILTLEAEGPDFTQPGKMAMYRDIYEFKSKDLFIMSSQTQGSDGKWITFMSGDVTRQK